MSGVGIVLDWHGHSTPPWLSIIGGIYSVVYLPSETLSTGAYVGLLPALSTSGEVKP